MRKRARCSRTWPPSRRSAPVFIFLCGFSESRLSFGAGKALKSSPKPSLFTVSLSSLSRPKQQQTKPPPPPPKSHPLLVGKEVDAGDEAVLALQARAALRVAQGPRLLGLCSAFLRERERVSPCFFFEEQNTSQKGKRLRNNSQDPRTRRQSAPRGGGGGRARPRARRGRQRRWSRSERRRRRQCQRRPPLLGRQTRSRLASLLLLPLLRRPRPLPRACCRPFPARAGSRPGCRCSTKKETRRDLLASREIRSKVFLRKRL